LDDADKGDRQAAIFAVLAMRETSAIPALQRIADSDPLPNLARAAQSAVASLKAPPATPGADLSALRNRLAEIEKENGELKARIDRLEKK
jgi:hypothetical protein